MRRHLLVWVFLGLMAVLSGGCVTDSIALRLYQDHDRISIGSVKLGANQREVLNIAEDELGKTPVCVEKKVGNKNNKMAVLEQTCVFKGLENIRLSGREIVEVRYFFVGAYLQQIDIELVAKNKDSMDEMARELSNSLNLEDEKQGLLHKWIGSLDAALLIQQGNIKLRIVPLAQLPENSKGPTILPRT